jgi:hypothetical protein
MNDQYCKKCHADVHAQWSDSVHRFSSFNNPPYLATVTETREVALKRDGNVQASRWCAGCHDPVPFFSGAFDDPKFDTVSHPTAHSGITCSACHSITHVNSTRGNADYTIEEPLQYPFAYSENPVLQWINNQLVKAKPEFHKKTFLKGFHRTAEFCSTCHKVHLPLALNHYTLRGQNHTTAWSGVSGHACSFGHHQVGAEPHAPHAAWPSGDCAKLLGRRAQVHDHFFRRQYRRGGSTDRKRRLIKSFWTADARRFVGVREGVDDGTLTCTGCPRRTGTDLLLEG